MNITANETSLASLQQNGMALQWVPEAMLTTQKGSRGQVKQFGEYVEVGCQTHTLSYWLANYIEIGKEFGYTNKEIAEYGAIFKDLSLTMK